MHPQIHHQASIQKRRSSPTTGQTARELDTAIHKMDICLNHLFTSALFQLPTKRLFPSMDPPSLTNLAFANCSVECVVCPRTKDSFQFTEMESGILRRSSLLGLCMEGDMTSQGGSTLIVRSVQPKSLRPTLPGWLPY